MAKIVIGLVGPIASGKGTVIDILKNKGYTPYSLSDALKEEIRLQLSLVISRPLARISSLRASERE